MYLFLFYCRFSASFFGTESLQNTMLKFCLNIFLFNILTYIEASLAWLLRNALCGCNGRSSFSCSSLSRPFAALNCQITIFQRCLNLIFCKSRQINNQLISHLSFSLISVFIRFCRLSYHTASSQHPSYPLSIIKRKVVKEIIKQIFSKNTRH